MRVDKIILKAFLSTFAAIVILFAFMFGVLVAAFPATMMQLSYDFGCEKSSIRYAERAYNWFDDTSYMAYAMEVAIGIDNQEKIEDCGMALVEDETYFAQYCEEKTSALDERVQATMRSGYDQYVYGKISVAKYEQGKKEDAVNYAFECLNGGFPYDNAAVAVLYTAVVEKDQATVDMVKGKMNEMQATGFSAEEKAYFDEVLALTI